MPEESRFSEFEGIEERLHPYPLRQRWSKVFKPHIPAVQRYITQACRIRRPQFDPRRQMPREAGWTFDAPWPRSRTGLRAHQMFGFCHLVAAYALAFAQAAFPEKKWAIFNALEHSVVIAADGTLLDFNLAYLEPEQVVEHARSKIFESEHEVLLFDDVDEYLARCAHLCDDDPEANVGSLKRRLSRT